MLHAHYSNRTERLAATLAAVLRDGSSAPGPCQQEILVVNNAGMGRWLALEVARANGIAANIRTQFPAELAWLLLRAAFASAPERNAYEPRYLAWHLFALLGEVAGTRGFEAVERYLGSGDDYRRWSLARQLARIYDQYIVYRPDWIYAFERERSGDWQAALWRSLVARLGDGHWANLQHAFVEAAAADALDASRLPARVNVFGIPTLSPGYLKVLAAAARFTDVHLYWFNPCGEYWADIATDHELGDGDDEYRERGNALLANWGRQGRETLDLLLELGAQEDGHFEPADGDTVLAAVQNDILELVDRGDTAAATWPQANDDSIAVHACHSPMREIEVLHDQLLARFNDDPDLEPSDVLVMTPDIETYAPIIDAVFSTAPQSLGVPYTIADQSLRARMPVVSAFLSLLELDNHRATPEFVLSLLQVPSIADAFDLDANDLDVIRGWIHATAIRWGFDADHRERLGVAATAEHTWRSGLERLVLGYAMPADTAFGGVLPWSAIEPADARTLGRFHRFVSLLDATSQRLVRPRGMADWARELTRLLDTFFQPRAEDEDALASLRDAIVTLAADGASALGGDEVSIDVVRECLQAAGESAGDRSGFLSGGVTFCSLMPMRSIPFQLICLVGMDDAAFPRIATPPTLDRMGGDYRRGDRSRREDDRYLFLEILLSARKSLYISYIGRSIKDNSPSPPAVVVSDLIDYIGQGLVDAGVEREARRGELLERLVTTHSLQAFDRRYFAGARRYPGHIEDFARAAAAAQRPVPVAPFVASTLDPIEFDDVSLEALVAFYSNPARYLLRQRFGVWLDEGDEGLDDREPFSIDRDAAEAIRRQWMSCQAVDGDLDACEAALRQAGLLPHGLPGRVRMEREITRFETVRAVIAEALGSPSRERQSVDLHMDGSRVVGWLDQVRDAGLFRYYLRDHQARDRIRLVIEHLAGCAAGVLPGPSRLVTMNGVFVFEPLTARTALATLQPWLQRFRDGHCRPAHFFPRSAWTWFDARDKEDRLDRARKTWAGSNFSMGEAANAYYRKAFGDADPIDASFEAHASALLLPVAEFMSSASS